MTSKTTDQGAAGVGMVIAGYSDVTAADRA
jgi:hypothetical protein